MRVLHVGLTNIAGVPGLLVKGLRHKGIKADLVVYERHAFGFPEECVLDGRPWGLLFKILKLSRDYDLIHLHGFRHSFNIDVFALRMLMRKLLIHLHGTEIRVNYERFSVILTLKISECVLVSTPDLLRYYPRAKWLPNPIDSAFKPLNNPRKRGKALYFRKWYELGKEKIVKEQCLKMGLELFIPSNSIPHNRMPSFLNQFEVFFDQFTIPSLSKTALEALACGCRVVSWKGLVTDEEEILKNHSLPIVTQKLTKIYEELLR